MAKKAKIAITRDEDFKDIDEELDRAMDRLEDTNARIDEVLSEHEGDDEGSEAVDGEGGPVAAKVEEGDGDEQKAESSDDSA